MKYTTFLICKILKDRIDVHKITEQKIVWYKVAELLKAITRFRIEHSVRNNHLTESTWPNEYDRKICTWPKRLHRRTWTMELDRKSMTMTNMNGWIWRNQKIKITSLRRPTYWCECDWKFKITFFGHILTVFRSYYLASTQFISKEYWSVGQLVSLHREYECPSQENLI